MPPIDLYLAHQQSIERAIAAVCRRQLVPASEAEDFAGHVRLQLLEDGAAVLKKFEGRSSMQTYLQVVVTRCFQDWRNARWGKWRPSAAAKRLGPLAVKLETMVIRDGLSMEQAHEMLRTNHGVEATRRALEDLVCQFPVRASRTFVSDAELAERPGVNPHPDVPLRQEAVGVVASAAATALNATMGRMSASDRLILRMRFQDNVTVADIARMTGTDAKSLYRRIQTLLDQCRAGLERAGIGADQALDVLELHGFESSQLAWETVGGVRLLERRGRSREDDMRAK